MIKGSPGPHLCRRCKQHLRQGEWEILAVALTECLAWGSAAVEIGNLVGDRGAELEIGSLKTHLMQPAK